MIFVLFGLVAAALFFVAALLAAYNRRADRSVLYMAAGVGILSLAFFRMLDERVMQIESRVAALETEADRALAGAP